MYQSIESCRNSEEYRTLQLNFNIPIYVSRNKKGKVGTIQEMKIIKFHTYTVLGYFRNF